MRSNKTLFYISCALNFLNSISRAVLTFQFHRGCMEITVLCPHLRFRPHSHCHTGSLREIKSYKYTLIQPFPWNPPHTHYRDVSIDLCIAVRGGEAEPQRPSPALSRKLADLISATTAWCLSTHWTTTQLQASVCVVLCLCHAWVPLFTGKSNCEPHAK